MRINFTGRCGAERRARQLAWRVFRRHFADASANCDYVTPLKSTSIIIIYDVITRWEKAERKTAGEATTTKKNMHKPIAFDVCSHNVSYTQCEQASQPRKWARYVHVLRIRHALKWLWQIIFLVNAFNMVINQTLTNTHTEKHSKNHRHSQL